jgi:hypothetical protein
MKRTLLVLSLITLTATISQAQYNTKTKIMIFGEGGYNIASFFQSASTEKALELKSIYKPVVGLYVLGKYPTLMGFDAGFALSQQGTYTRDSFAAAAIFPDSAISKAVLNYAYVYTDGMYYFELIGDNTAHAGAGLYAGYLINGDQVPDNGDKKKLVLDDWKKFDLGLQLKVAFSYHELINIGVQYRIAFLKTLESIDRKGDHNNLRNSVFTVTAGLRLFTFKSK